MLIATECLISPNRNRNRKPADREAADFLAPPALL